MRAPAADSSALLAGFGVTGLCFAATVSALAVAAVARVVNVVGGWLGLRFCGRTGGDTVGTDKALGSEARLTAVDFVAGFLCNAHCVGVLISLDEVLGGVDKAALVIEAADGFLPLMGRLVCLLGAAVVFCPCGAASVLAVP
jgi:hypothetical protein